MPTVWREAWIGPGRGVGVAVTGKKVAMERFWRLVGWEVKEVELEGGMVVWWLWGAGRLARKRRLTDAEKRAADAGLRSGRLQIFVTED